MGLLDERLDLRVVETDLLERGSVHLEFDSEKEALWVEGGSSTRSVWKALVHITG